MAATLETIDDILKIDYKDPIIEHVNNKNLLLHLMKGSDEWVSGKESYRPLHTSRNEGLGARLETEELPVAGNQGYNKARFGMAYLYATIKVTNVAMVSSRDNSGAFIQALDGEIQGLMNDLPRDMNRQLHSPKRGDLCIAANATGTSVVTGDGNLTAAQFETQDARFLRVNMFVDVYSPSTTGSGTARATNLKINSIAKVVATADSATWYRVTLSGNMTSPADGDIVVRTGNFCREVFGLPDIISDTNPIGIASNFANGNLGSQFGAIDRDTVGNEFWQAVVADHGGAAFADTIFQDMIDTVERESDGNPEVFVTTYDIFNAYARTLLPDRRFNTTGSRFSYMDGGYEHLQYNDRDVVKDRDCPVGTCYALDTAHLGMDHMAEWDWMDEDGAILTRVGRTPQYEASLFKYCETVSGDPSKQAVTTNIG